MRVLLAVSCLLISTAIGLETEPTFGLYGDVQTCPLTNEKVVYLTFDDGPHKNLVHMAEKLSSHGMNATFFPNAMALKNEKYAEMYRKIRALGHDIGSHSWEHLNLLDANTDFVEQIDHAHCTLRDVLGFPVAFFRAPGGKLNRHMADALRTHFRYVIFRWSVDSQDMRWVDTAKVIDVLNHSSLLKHEHGGDIVLFHIQQWGARSKLETLIQFFRDRCSSCHFRGLSACLERGALPSHILPIASTTHSGSLLHDSPKQKRVLKRLEELQFVRQFWSTNSGLAQTPTTTLSITQKTPSLVTTQLMRREANVHSFSGLVPSIGSIFQVALPAITAFLVMVLAFPCCGKRSRRKRLFHHVATISVSGCIFVGLAIFMSHSAASLHGLLPRTNSV